MGSEPEYSKRWGQSGGSRWDGQTPVEGVVAVVDDGRTVSSVDKTGLEVVVEGRPRWWLMALVAGFDGSGKHRWTLVAVAGSGKVADRGDGGCRVVMDVEVDVVDGGGDKGVVVMGSRQQPDYRAK